MKVNSLQHAAQTLLQLMVHRKKAYQALHQSQKISSGHPAFQYLDISIKKLKVVADGDTQRFNVMDCIKHSPGMYYVAKKKFGSVILTQKEKLDSCILYMNEFAYTHKPKTL